MFYQCVLIIQVIMKKEKASRIVKGYSLVIGWLLLSPLLLIPGYMLDKRVDDKRPCVGPVIALTIMFGMFFVIFLSISFFSITDWISLLITLTIGLIINFLIFGIPLVYSIIYLIEERKNPTIPPTKEEIIQDKLNLLKKLFDEGRINEDEYNHRKSQVLGSI